MHVGGNKVGMCYNVSSLVFVTRSSHNLEEYDERQFGRVAAVHKIFVQL